MDVCLELGQMFGGPSSNEPITTVTVTEPRGRAAARFVYIGCYHCQLRIAVHHSSAPPVYVTAKRGFNRPFLACHAFVWV